MKRCLLFVLSWFLVGMVPAQQELEIVPLKSRSVEQVLPSLLPLVERGGSLSGMNNQLFIRASARNREEIKRALAAIDTPARRLVIRVSQNRGIDENNRGGAAAGQIVMGSTRRVEGNAQVWDSRSMRSENSAQMVQTVEGGSAFIQVGTSLPIPLRQVVMGSQGVVVTDTVVYRDIGQGFYAIPRLQGENLTLEISQQADTPAPAYGPGGTHSQRLSTTIHGRLGEWIELGGSGRQATGSDRGSLSLSTGEVRENRSLWLKVEEIR